MQVHVFVVLTEEIGKPGVRFGKTLDLPHPIVPGTEFQFLGDSVGCRFVAAGFRFVAASLELVERSDTFEIVSQLAPILVPPGPIRDELIEGLLRNGWQEVEEVSGAKSCPNDSSALKSV